MDGVAGGKNGVSGLASKVKDIDGKLKPKSILKNTKHTGMGLDEESIRAQFNADFPAGLSSGLKSGNSEKEDVHGKGVHGVSDESMHKPVAGNSSYADTVCSQEQVKKVDFRALKNDDNVDGSDVVIPLSSIKEVSAKFDNTLYGYFIGKRLAYPIVEQFARNTWAKFGYKRAMMNGKGFFFFQFDSKVGFDRVLEEGPWMIRNIPIILNVWSPSVSLNKEGTKVVPVWVKLHDIPLVAFTEDGLSLIATKLGNPKRLDGYTSDMCRDLWGRSSFARALIEVSSDRELVEEIVVAIPSVDGEGYVKETIKVEYDWKPPRCGTCCVFGHTDAKCAKNVVEKPIDKGDEVDEEGFKTVKGKTKHGKQKVGNSSRLNVNPKIIYRPVSNPLELPVYRKKAAEWKKKHPNAKIRTEYIPKNRGNNRGDHNIGNGDFLHRNQYEVLDSDDPETDVEVDEKREMESSGGKESEGASTPGNVGLNG